MHLDKAMTSKSVISLLHDERGGPPHCFSKLSHSKYVNNYHRSLLVRLKWVVHVERMGDEKLAGIRSPESGKKEMRKNEHLMGRLHSETSGD